MSRTLAFTVPGEPKGKGRPRFARMGKGPKAFVRTYTPTETVTAENWIRLHAIQEAGTCFPPFDGPIALQIRFYLAKPKKPKWAEPATRPDVDNLAKAVLDALNQAGIWTDDARVVTLVVHKFYATDSGPRTEVQIRELEQRQVHGLFDRKEQAF